MNTFAEKGQADPPREDHQGASSLSKVIIGPQGPRKRRRAVHRGEVYISPPIHGLLPSTFCLPFPRAPGARSYSTTTTAVVVRTCRIFYLPIKSARKRYTFSVTLFVFISGTSPVGPSPSQMLETTTSLFFLLADCNVLIV